MTDNPKVYEETPYGFRYRSATVERLMSGDKKGWTLLGLSTPRHGPGKKLPRFEIYVTKTGKVRIFCGPVEWGPKT